MATVYVLQVMAHHGVGTEGWRTVRRSGGEAYRFQTYEAAHAALQKHFANLREGINVRVHTMEASEATTPLAGMPPGPETDHTPPLERQRQDQGR